MPNTHRSKKVNFLRNVKLKISVRPGGPGELIVSWQEFSESQIIEGYHVYWKFEGGGMGLQQETIENSKTNRYILSYLQNFTSYAVQVVTYFNTFQGIRSEYAYSKTTNEAISLKMSIENYSDSITVKWKPLWKRNSGEDEVKNYTVSTNLNMYGEIPPPPLLYRGHSETAYLRHLVIRGAL